MIFSYDSFRAMLRAVKERGYQFRRIDESDGTGGRSFYLRHDVDISPSCALRLGGITQEEGAVSSFFFQLNAETYAPFSPQLLSTIRSLRGMGHCVGLHVDEQLVGADAGKIAATLRWFHTCCEPIDYAVSFHRPSPAVLGVRFQGFSSGYDATVWGEDRYLSDSRRNEQFYPKLMDWLDEARAPIQLLLHPEWWSPHTTPDQVWQNLRLRREQELARYARTNFAKVFGSIVPDSTQDFGI